MSESSMYWLSRYDLHQTCYAHAILCFLKTALILNGLVGTTLLNFSPQTLYITINKTNTGDYIVVLVVGFQISPSTFFNGGSRKQKC